MGTLIDDTNGLTTPQFWRQKIMLQSFNPSLNENEPTTTTISRESTIDKVNVSLVKRIFIQPLMMMMMMMMATTIMNQILTADTEDHNKLNLKSDSYTLILNMN